MTDFIPETVEEKTPPQAVPVVQQLILVSAVLLLLLGGAITPHVKAWLAAEPDVPRTVTTDTDTKAPAETTLDFYSDLSLTADAVHVYDITRREVLYSLQPDKQLPLASVTKLMTALVAHELLQEEGAVTVDSTALRQDGYSNLLLDEVFTREALSDLTLISSTNDAAYALASAAGSQIDAQNGAAAFVSAMNIKSEELGLTQTTFNNPTGLDVSTTKAGAYGSARDVSTLMQHIYETYPELLEATTNETSTITSEQGFSHEAINTNYYLDTVPGLIGSKTGYTDLAGGNLVVAFNAGLKRPVIVTVLGSTRHDRFTDVQKLVEANGLHMASQQ